MNVTHWFRFNRVVVHAIGPRRSGLARQLARQRAAQMARQVNRQHLDRLKSLLLMAGQAGDPAGSAVLSTR